MVKKDISNPIKGRCYLEKDPRLACVSVGHERAQPRVTVKWRQRTV